jgi:hypothetical protein
MAMLYLVRFKRTAPDYNPDQHISYEVWEMLYFSRSRPQMKTAWKYVQMFEQYAPHQILTPLDIFPVFCPHTCLRISQTSRAIYPRIRSIRTSSPLHQRNGLNGRRSSSSRYAALRRREKP